MTKILVVKITNAYFVCLVVGLILFLGTTNLVFYDSFIICDIESLIFQTGTEKKFLKYFLYTNIARASLWESSAWFLFKYKLPSLHLILSFKLKKIVNWKPDF